MASLYKEEAGTPLLKVAIYIRVSTSHQIDRDSIPMQRKDLAAYSELILGTSNYVYFEDAGYSGKNTERPAYKEMMERVRKHEFSHVLVWKIDRISRNLLDFSEMYLELQKLRVVFVSKSEQFDTSTAVGEAMLKIILVFAELERKMTSERVRATMISKASSGEWNGGKIPYGYSYDKETATFSIVEEEAAVCRILRDDYLKFHSIIHSTKLLNDSGYKSRSGKPWSTTTCWKILSSPFYAGIYRYNRYRGTEHRTINPSGEWVLVPDHHPAIFTVEEHEKMAAFLADNSRRMNTLDTYNYKRNTYVFSGLLFCDSCGSRMLPQTGRKHKDGYNPATYYCAKTKKTRSCDNRGVSDSVVGEFVLNYILNMLNAKKSFSFIKSPEALEERLLSGSSFSEIVRLEESGLHEFYNLLSNYSSDDSFVFSMKKPKKRKASVDPEVSSLRKERERQERALKRLESLYLYSDNPLSEREFILRSAEINDKIEAVNKKLGLISTEASSVLSDEDFVRQASHILVSSLLRDKEYVFYRNIATNTSPEVLHDYFASIIDSVRVYKGRVMSIVFKNGLTHKFLYE